MLNDVNYIEVDPILNSEYYDNNTLHASNSYEINENKSDELVIISRDYSCKMSDTTSEKTFSSLGNEFETILYDHTAIIKCLSTDSFQRSPSDIGILIQLLQSIPDFMCTNSTELEYMCQAAKLITISLADEIIIKKCSVLCEWYFCLEGSLRKEDPETTLLGPGNFIGTDLWGGENMISDYDLYSNCDNCKLLVINSDDLKPDNQLNNPIIKISDIDKSVLAIYEAYTNVSGFDDMCSYVLSKGTPEVLTSHLFSDPKSVSEDYVEDFFLTHRLFLNSTKNIRNDIANTIYLENEYARDKFNILIRWISQSYPVFEKYPSKLLFIDQIIGILKSHNNNNWLYDLYECCSNCAKVREITDVIELKDYVIPFKISDYHTLFYIHKISDIDLGLRNGDVIIELDGHSQEAVTMDMITSLSNEKRPITVLVKNDLLGYHEYIVKDISIDSVSVHSTPSNTRYSHCSSDKMFDVASLSTNDSDNSNIQSIDLNIPIQKAPSILPNFMTNWQTGTVGRFFKNPKHYGKNVMSNNSRSNSDVTTRLDILQNGNTDLVGSAFSIPRFSRRFKSKRQRRSVGSNPDLIKSLEDLDVSESFSMNDYKTPIRIYLKNDFIHFSSHSSSKIDLRFCHIVIQPYTTVTEIIVRTLLKLNLVSASSLEFFLVEVKVNESSGMIHEKILSPNTSNLIDRLKEQCRFYLKHRSFTGASLILQSEGDKIQEEFKLPTLLQMPINSLVVRLFLRNYKQLCKIQPDELIDHVTNNKATLKYHRGSIQSGSGIFEYMHQSDFYKYWVITEICSEDSNINTRALTIQYFINLSLKAISIGHLDLFFSLLSGLDSTQVSKLSLTWDKVPKRDKKLLRNLKMTLDVSGNMRYLRSIHQKLPSPIIPVTAMTIKDLTMLEETQPTYASGTVKGYQVNRFIVNFDKMRKMSKVARIFFNSICSCAEDKSRPVRKHMSHCKVKWENQASLERLLQRRLENINDNHFLKLFSDSIVEKPNRKFSVSTISVQSSSSESMTESEKSNEDKSNCQIFEQLMMTMKIERYLRSLDDRVIIDSAKLTEMASICEHGNTTDGGSDSKQRHSSKVPKVNTEMVTELAKEPDVKQMSAKAAEILGLREKSKIHKYKSPQHRE